MLIYYIEMCKVVQYGTNIYPDLSFLAQLPIVGHAAELLNLLVTLLWNSQTRGNRDKG